MGGLVCAVHRNAILQFQTIPIDAAQLVQFDAQIRQLIADYDMNLVSDNPTPVIEKLCAVLAKRKFDLVDRQFMLDLVEALYEGYL